MSHSISDLREDAAGPFEKAAHFLRRLLFPLGLFGAAIGVWNDISSPPIASAGLYAFYGVFLLPCLLWKAMSLDADSRGPLEKIGRQIDQKRTHGKKFSFGGWRSALSILLAGITAFVGSFYLFDGIKGFLIGIGASTPLGAALAGISTMIIGCFTLFGAYASIKKSIEWLTGKKEETIAQKLNLPWHIQFKMMLIRKAKELSAIFTKKFWKENWPKVMGSVLALGFAALLGVILIGSLPVSMPGAIALTAIFGLCAYVGMKSPIQQFCEKAVRTVQRLIVGLLLKKPTNHLHTKDKQELYDNQVWNSLSFIKRAAFAYLPAALLATGAMLPTVLCFGFPPLGAALLGIAACGITFMMIYPAIRSMIIKMVKRSRGLSDKASEVDKETGESESATEELDSATCREQALSLGVKEGIIFRSMRANNDQSLPANADECETPTPSESATRRMA